ncbi:hypothetical protein KP509_21G005000 [Ceratopteris richardii]|nr:hypothetical protein KP509_21G005000 [Ceratopteris richardii]
MRCGHVNRPEHIESIRKCDAVRGLCMPLAIISCFADGVTHSSQQRQIHETVEVLTFKCYSTGSDVSYEAKVWSTLRLQIYLKTSCMHSILASAYICTFYCRL